MSDEADWSGRSVVVTGANSGIGLEVTRALLARGATVVMACRSIERGRAAAGEVGSGSGSGRVVVRRLDLAHFASIASFAEETGGEQIHGLVNNAAVMACPLRFTADGLEMQMGTNHLGHALLTSLLLEKLAPGARIVVVGSVAARGGRLGRQMTAEDLTAPVPYRAQTVYSNTKQANLLFAAELQRRLGSSTHAVTVVAAHPGVAATELFSRQLRDNGRGFLVPLVRPGMRLVLQSAKAGAAPVLRALLDPSLAGGEFIGPRHLGQTRGRPQLLRPFKTTSDPATASRLFDVTEEVLGAPILR